MSVVRRWLEKIYCQQHISFSIAQPMIVCCTFDPGFRYFLHLSYNSFSVYFKVSWHPSPQWSYNECFLKNISLFKGLILDMLLMGIVQVGNMFSEGHKYIQCSHLVHRIIFMKSNILGFCTFCIIYSLYVHIISLQFLFI